MDGRQRYPVYEAKVYGGVIMSESVLVFDGIPLVEECSYCDGSGTDPGLPNIPDNWCGFCRGAGERLTADGEDLRNFIGWLLHHKLLEEGS